MREIKFRAWDTVLKAWKTDEWCRRQEIWSLSPNSSRYVWTQFTGLHDKNGIEIYEGDIVKYSHPSFGNKTARKVSVVEWRDAHHNRGVGFNVGASPYNEVIGNIYENPEMMERKVGTQVA